MRSLLCSVNWIAANTCLWRRGAKWPWQKVACNKIFLSFAQIIRPICVYWNANWPVACHTQKQHGVQRAQSHFRVRSVVLIISLPQHVASPISPLIIPWWQYNSTSTYTTTTATERSMMKQKDLCTVYMNKVLLWAGSAQVKLSAPLSQNGRSLRSPWLNDQLTPVLSQGSQRMKVCYC